MRRTYRRPKPKIDKNIFRINGQITAPQLRIIDADDNNIGVLSTQEALRMAQEQELDLVEVFPKAQPPVAKITDYGRMKYQKEKQMQKQQAKQKKVETKSIRMSLRISEHDRQLRYKQALKFLENGNKLKVDVLLKGREKQLQNKAREIITNFINQLKAEESLNIAEEQALTKQLSGFNIIVINKFK
ncbi:MAG: translation initiation factor IF-3 [bacterium]|nr:translation initiation factor IF-3 [bacterium]